MAIRLIGPYAASDDGRLKIPTPMIVPTINAVAGPRPRDPRGSDSASGGPGGPAVPVGVSEVLLTGFPPRRPGCARWAWASRVQRGRPSSPPAAGLQGSKGS